MKLSSREKRLLYLSGMVVILAVGMTRFVLPAYEAYASGEEAYAAAVEEAEIWAEELDRLTRLEDGSGELLLEYEKWRGAYPLPMANDILERQVLSRLEAHGLIPLNTTVTNKGTTDLKPKNGSAVVTEGSAKAVKAEVSVTAKGSMEDFFSFVNDLEEVGYLKIESFQMKGCSGQESPDISVLVSCYMLEDMDETK